MTDGDVGAADVWPPQWTEDFQGKTVGVDAMCWMHKGGGWILGDFGGVADVCGSPPLIAESD